MKGKLPLVAGILMAPVSACGLLWGWASIWVICPQALVVMFARQARHAYDSIGAPDYPDLAVAVLYYPVVGWIVHRAVKLGKVWRVGVRVALWHIAAIAVALGAAAVRNKLWSIGFGHSS